jgi:oligopeptidase A
MSHSGGVEDASNPLEREGGLPAFDQIRPEHVAPGVRSRLAQLEGELARLEADVEPSWSGLVEPLERLGDRMQSTWGTVGHLMGVKNSDALRAAHDEVQAEVVTFSLRLAQSRAIYDGLVALREGAGWSALGPDKQRIALSLLRDARHAGVGLDGVERERFNEIQRELAELATRFSNHVQDATKAFALDLSEPAEVDGLPTSLLRLAAHTAGEARRALEEGTQSTQATEGDTAEADDPVRGPWRITLDYPSFVPFMEHSTRRDLRERLYRVYITRASSGEFDNAPLIERILALRRELAQLLDYEDFGTLSLATKMAPDVAAVEALLEKLRTASFDAARRDLSELQAFAKEEGFEGELQLWDIAFWSERLREARFAYSEESLRPYFPLPVVIEGLFALARRLFGVTIVAADGEASVWHEDVRFFRVKDEDGRDRAAFYLDPYSRPADKRGGAWMDECVGRSALLAAEPGGVRLPVAYLVCNQAPPVEGKPSQMSFDEVTTLFHEFGHGLQHMLTRVDLGLASGIRNIEWDAIELPSQFMENWLYHRETLKGVSCHVDTGKAIPDSLFDKIEAARTYRAGSDMLRQLYFSFTDMELHAAYEPGGADDAFSVQRRIAEKTTVLPPLPDDRFLCSFSHIFAGGYAAGYYSYKWSEVLSADAFAAFEEAGLDDEPAVVETGRRYRETVLALGGSQSPMEVFVAFRGREPSTRPLLRHSGLL